MNYETSLIAALLSQPKGIANAKIKSSQFEDAFLAKVFSVMRDLVKSGVDIDVISISSKMQDESAFLRLVSLQRESSYSVKNINVYCAVIRDDAKLRNQKAIIKNAAIKIDGNAGNVVGELVTELARLNDEQVDHAYTAKEMLQLTVESMEERMELKEQGKLAGVPTGMKKMDGILGGYHKSDLVIVGARPSVGKTSYMLSSAINAAKQGFKVGIISTEMSATQIGDRIVSLASGVHASSMRDSTLTAQDWPLITAGISLASSLDLFIYDKPVCTVSDIAIQAMAWDLSHGVDIIFIDYLTRIKPETSENRTIAIGNIATDLKTLARTMDIPVVCLAQLSRELEKRQDKVPQMSDLRDSGVIEQEADQVLMLYRESVYDYDAPKDSAQINIAKNRHGETPLLNMQFKPQTMEWCDESDYYGM